MISVLIPVFNDDVNELAASLSDQLSFFGCKGEIIIIDDGSEASCKVRNRKVQRFSNVRYFELEHNTGRIHIRNLLASKALNDWLLFIDGDSIIIEKDFLKKYIQAIDTSSGDVIIGGRIYGSEKPAQCNLVLHWKYGRLRESRAVSGFMTNNFCICKKIFRQLQFEMPLKGYGHEDTLIGMQMEKMGISIQYIYNPVLHKHIKQAPVFLQNAHEALTNLSILAGHGDNIMLKKHVKLFRWYGLLKKLRLEALILHAVNLFQKPMLCNLYSCYPSLLLFDCYRLGKFIAIMNNKKKV